MEEKVEAGSRCANKVMGNLLETAEKGAIQGLAITYLWGFHVVRHQGQHHPSAWIGVAHFQILGKQRNPVSPLLQHHG